MASATGQLDNTLGRMDYGRALKRELLMNDTSDLHVSYAQPLLDAVALFESLEIGYALIGGIAAMYYGRSRFTEDVDFVAVTGHMEIFAAHPDVLERCHFASDCACKLYHKSGVVVDFWKDEHSDKIAERAVVVDLAGRPIRMIDLYDLLAMKLRARRLKDDYDISQIVLTNNLDEQKLATMVTLIN